METKEVYSRAQIKLMITEDLVFRSSIWAVVMLIIWGLISFITVWFMLNVIVPSYEKKMKENKSEKEISFYERDYKRY